MNQESALARILDREGLYWTYPGQEQDDPSRIRWVEIRIDTPAGSAFKAKDVLAADGWKLTSQPDQPDDPIQRLYFRRRQSLEPNEREAMLKAGYEAAVAASGRFWSWINLDDEHSN